MYFTVFLNKGDDDDDDDNDDIFYNLNWKTDIACVAGGSGTRMNFCPERECKNPRRSW